MNTRTASAFLLLVASLFLMGLPALANGAVSIESVTVLQEDVDVLLANADTEDRGVMVEVTAELVGGDVVTEYRFVYTQAQSVATTNVEFEKKVKELINVGLISESQDPM